MASKTACGKTSPGSGWRPAQNKAGDKEIVGIYIDVDTGSFAFSETPRYAISLSGASYEWATTGGDAVCNPTENGFEVYVKRSDGAALTPQDARDCGLYINWLALEGESITLESVPDTIPES